MTYGQPQSWKGPSAWVGVALSPISSNSYGFQNLSEVAQPQSSKVGGEGAFPGVGSDGTLLFL